MLRIQNAAKENAGNAGCIDIQDGVDLKNPHTDSPLMSISTSRNRAQASQKPDWEA